MAEYGFGNPEVVEEEVDILIIGGGMAACGAAFEIMKWAKGTDLKIKLVDKAAMDRPGAVSSTHLRAHETGRNLVSRLLLEKKNYA